MQPDSAPLSVAARDVLAELESLAGEYPERWIPGWLRKPRWWQR